MDDAMIYFMAYMGRWDGATVGYFYIMQGVSLSVSKLRAHSYNFHGRLKFMHAYL